MSLMDWAQIKQDAQFESEHPHTHECENCHKQYEHAVVITSKYGTPCTEIRNGHGFCSQLCEDAYPKRGSTVHAVGCPCGFCKAGFTKA